MDIHTSFSSISLANIENFINTSQEENLFLDFKEATSADLSAKDDKKNLAKALSGFANSSGGLIFWGIDARKNENGVDCAVAKKPIKDIFNFIARLNALTGESVIPLVDSVQHKAVIETASQGYAVTLVPASDAGPHRALGGLNHYYKRSGDSFYRMEHFDLEDMFGRRKKPLLSLDSVLRRGSVIGGQGDPRTTYEINIIVGIRNQGRGIAKYPYLALRVISPHHLEKPWNTVTPNLNLQALNDWDVGGEFQRFGATDSVVVHPHTFLQVARIKVSLSQETLVLEDIVIDFEIAAEDFPLKRATWTYSGEKLLVDIHNMLAWEGAVQKE